MTPSEVFEHARSEALVPIRQDRRRVSHPGLKRILSHLEDHLFDADLSMSQLRRKGPFPGEAWAAFPRELGMDPKAYTVDRKLSGAAWLLRCSDLEILFVADFAGYSGSSSFDNAFSKWAGCVPSQYRQTMQGEDVIEVVADEMESAEFWWKAIFQLLKPGQVKRLFDRFVEWYPFLHPRSEARAKTWRLCPQGLARPEALYQAVWRAVRRLPPELRLQMLRDQLACERAADFFQFLCGKSLEVGREEPDLGVEVMELTVEFVRGSKAELGNEFSGLEALGLARLANSCILANDFVSAKTYLQTARDAWKGAGSKYDLISAEIKAYEATSYMLQGELKKPGSSTTGRSNSVRPSHPAGCSLSA